MNVPSNSPTSVSNTALAWGGGDLTHTSLATAATGSDSNVPVVQVPASITINGMATQSANVLTAFGSLAVTVLDAGGVAIPNYSSVTFTATTGGSGQSGTFSNSTGTISVNTNGSGIADPGTFTANAFPGSYTVGVAAGSATATFNLTNTAVIVAAATSTSVSSNNNPSFTAAPNNSVTFTATVTSNSTVNEGTVTFSDTANDFTCSGGNTVSVSNGTASCTTSFTTEGSRNVTAAYNGTVNFQASSGFVSQVANNHTVVTGNQFCNQGAITVPSNAGAATPYPSNIFVTGLGNIGAVTVALNNISSSNIQETDLLLVGPTGAAIVPFASVGDGSTISGVNVTLDDAAASLIPGGSPLVSGSFKPTSITGSTSLAFPAPAPKITTANYAATDGSATLTSQFGGTAANGTWALYAMDNSGNGAASIGGGWCVNITPATTQITITTSPANLLVSVDGGTFTAAPLVESWTAGSSHTIATTSPQSGGSGVQYVWSNWSDAGAISHSITVPSSATTYTATFNTKYQLTTVASPSADGSVTPASGSYYAGGAIIPVTATANAGFQFSNWTSTGGSFVSTTSASTNFTMPSAPATVTGNFAALRPMVNLKPISVNFGTVHLGSSHTENITVTNTGGATLKFTKVSLTEAAGNPDSFTFLNSCGSTLEPTKSCTITIGFMAKKIGSNSATLNIADNAASSPQHVPLSATVINPRAELDPHSLSFGTHTVGSSTTKNVILTNDGTTALDIFSVAITGADRGDFSKTNGCPSSLGAGDKCTISVTFDPQATGARSAGLTVTDNALAGTQTVSLSGTGD